MTGALPTDQATHEQSQQTVSAVPVGIPSAITRALAPLKGWSEHRLVGSRAERIVWEEYHRAAPDEIISSLQDAGYAIVPIGGNVPVTVSINRGEEWEMRATVRAQMQMKPLMVFAEQRIPTDYLTNPDLTRTYLPKVLARTMLAAFEDQMAVQIGQAIEAPHSHGETQ